MARLAKVDLYQSQTFDCYGIKVINSHPTNLFQSFVLYRGRVEVGDVFEIRDHAYLQASEMADRIEKNKDVPPCDI